MHYHCSSSCITIVVAHVLADMLQAAMGVLASWSAGCHCLKQLSPTQNECLPSHGVWCHSTIACQIHQTGWGLAHSIASCRIARVPSHSTAACVWHAVGRYMDTEGAIKDAVARMKAVREVEPCTCMAHSDAWARQSWLTLMHGQGRGMLIMPSHASQCLTVCTMQHKAGSNMAWYMLILGRLWDQRLGLVWTFMEEWRHSMAPTRRI